MITLEQAEEMLNQADELYNMSKFDEAIKIFEEIIPVFEANSAWKSLIKCLTEYGSSIKIIKQTDESEEILKNALKLSLDKFGEEQIETADCYLFLGIDYASNFKLTQAVDLIETALTIYTKSQIETQKQISDCYKYLGVCHQNIGDFKLAISYYNKALSFYISKFGEDLSIVANIYSYLSTCYDHLNNYEEAIRLLKSAISINVKLCGEENFDSAMYIGFLGDLLSKYGDNSQALKYLKKGMFLRQLVLGSTHRYTLNSLCNLGNFYFSIGDISTAFNYYIKELAIKIATLGKEHIDTSITFHNLGRYFLNTKNYEQAYKYFEQSLIIRKKIFGENSPSLSISYKLIGLVAVYMNNLQSAFNFLQKALKISLDFFGKVNSNTANCHSMFGFYYRKAKNYPKAIEQFKEALAVNLIIYGEVHSQTAKNYNHIAECYLEVNDIQNVLRFTQKALSSLGQVVSKNEFYLLPAKTNFNNPFSYFETLTIKADAFIKLFSQFDLFEDLAAALAHLITADQIIDQVRLTFNSEGSKLFLAEKCKNKLYNRAMDVTWDAEQFLYNNEQQIFSFEIKRINQAFGYSLLSSPIQTAFHFSEKSKSVLLYASIKDSEARLNAGLPVELIQKEFEFRLELTFLDQKIMTEKQKEESQQDKNQIIEWEIRHLNCKEQYDLLIMHFETDYPAYYQLKHDLKVAEIPQIQAALLPQTAMIGYVVSDKYLYSIVITAQNAHWLQQELPADFEGLIDDLLFSFEPFGKEDYITCAHNMYRILLQPLEQNGWLEGIGRLVIIPDGILSRIPFEALLAQSTSAATPYNQLNYLLHQYVISYHYSATLWLSQQTMDAHLPESETSFLGFAPVYNDNIQPAKEHDIDLSLDAELLANLDIELEEVARRTRYTESEGVTRGKVEGKEYAELHYTEKEVQQAGRAFAENGHTSRVLLHQSATLDAFKQLAGKYRYLLIAAHADMDDEHPEQTGIIFSPNEEDGRGIFYMSDAYNLPLQAELVVLSCCESGLGKINKGEGTIALNRGFLYAGAKNVVYTLFKVYDKESCELTTVFFQQLLLGLTCAEALHSAKLQLAERGLMPLKWAGYVLVGK